MYAPKPTCLVLALGAILSSPAHAEVKLPIVFGDHMVLQRGTPIPIWGWADPGERVSVTLNKRVDGRKVVLATHHVAIKADDAGRWLVKLPAVKAGGPFELEVRGKNTISLRDVLVGEVWICSGQSNMAWKVRQAKNPKPEIGAADYPRIRLFQVEMKTAQQPKEDTKGQWRACAPKTIPEFSAVGYYFGRHLHNELEIPIGLIQSAWGGTPAEAWTSAPTLEGDSDFRPILDRWDQIIANYPVAKKRHDERVAKWREASAEAKRSGRRRPRRPRAPAGPNHKNRPSNLYNGMIHPLLPFAMRGVIWYQGEANASRAYQYRKLFPAMIEDWRRAWGRGDFPFLFVQLANFKVRRGQNPLSWAELREAQLQTLSLENTAMAVTIDIGNPRNIHPKNKQEVGRRLALAALAKCYGRDLVYSGPILTTWAVSGNAIRLRFEHTGGGLVATGSEGLKGFQIAGADRKFVPAQAEIRGQDVLVHSDQVPKPVAVRYAWYDNPEANLHNKAWLPASPFRTDDWPGVTADKR